jgi:chromosome condensin MukBEF complex kleisin-like MukF subunit
VIVRLMGEGQWRIDDSLAASLHELDGATERAVEAEDQPALQTALRELADAVKAGGERLDDSVLEPSDLIVPPTDLTLAEAHELMHGHGLIPDIV